MAVEQYTESLTLREMSCTIGENPFGFVFPQGDVESVDKIENLLKKAGGKPKDCPLADYTAGGSGKAKPEYIITFNDDTSTIIVVECKKSVRSHASEDYGHPRDYAVDGNPRDRHNNARCPTEANWESCSRLSISLNSCATWLT